MIIKIQKRWNALDKKSYKTIMSEFQISLLTAKKYAHMSEAEIQAMDNPTVYKTRDKLMNDYVNIIYKMYINDIKPEMIFSYILKIGFKGTYMMLDSQVKRIIKNNFGVKLPMNWYLDYDYPVDVTLIKRNEVLKFITTKKEKKKKNKTVEANIKIIKEKYPVIRELEEIYNSFHSTIMGNDIIELDRFIDKYKNSKVKGFINGIEKDIAPITNAISFPYSSGFVEGNNNKFKLIKRILYGRSKIVNLFRKCYVPFLMNNVDFRLISLLK